MMPNPRFDGQSEIFGGIPIIFPRLGGWGEGKPFHGFARTAIWKKADCDESKVTLLLESDAFTRSIFDAEFVLSLTVSLGGSHLLMDLKVDNLGENDFEFTALFHNYIGVEDLREVSLRGFAETAFKDAADGWRDKRDEEETLRPKGPLDRVYTSTELHHKIIGFSGRGISIGKSETLGDTVVWTPWDNFSEGDFTKFLCVEPGNVVNPKRLNPKESFYASQMLRVES